VASCHKPPLASGGGQKEDTHFFKRMFVNLFAAFALFA
jgi:hypothetical protein